jgi:hypothetical protein
MLSHLSKSTSPYKIGPVRQLGDNYRSTSPNGRANTNTSPNRRPLTSQQQQQQPTRLNPESYTARMEAYTATARPQGRPMWGNKKHNPLYVPVYTQSTANTSTDYTTNTNTNNTLSFSRSNSANKVTEPTLDRSTTPTKTTNTTSPGGSKNTAAGVFSSNASTSTPPRSGSVPSYAAGRLSSRLARDYAKVGDWLPSLTLTLMLTLTLAAAQSLCDRFAIASLFNRSAIAS